MIQAYGDTFRFTYADGRVLDDISQASSEEVAELLASYRGLVRSLEHSLDEARKSHAARITPSGTVKIRIGTTRRRASPKTLKTGLAALADSILTADRETVAALIKQLSGVSQPKGVPQNVNDDDIPF